MKEIYEDAINFLKYYGEMNNEKIERISYFLEKELKNYIKLQSNWNSLREWLKNKIDKNGFEKFYIEDALYKMNELEGKDKE